MACRAFFVVMPAIATRLATVRPVPMRPLRPDAFRHPLDKDLTQLMQRTPTMGLLETAVRFGVAASLEPVTRLQNLAFAVRVSDTQYPRLHELLREACAALDVKEPELFVKQDPRPNAYTLAFDGDQPAIVATSSLITLLTDDEVKAVLAHELGHIKCDHSIWLTMGSLVWPNVPFAGPAMEALLGDWRRAAEFTCDRAALVVAKDVQVVTSALLKLVGGLDAPDGAAYLQQARDYEEYLKQTNPLVRSVFKRGVLSGLTHPLPVARVAELDKWANSPQYRAIVGP